MKRRILALFLSLCMILAMLPAHAFAQTAEPTTGYLSGSYRNPLYSHDECCTAEGRLEAPRTYTDGTLSEEDYLVEDADVLSAICAGLEQRQATITVPWKISRENISAETEQDDISNFLLAAFLLAMSHTGVPTQGDYLLWVYDEVSYGASYGYDSEYYYLDASYDVIYYTTAEQEAALTAKLETVMASFGFTDATDDYSKVKAIYDYICANVVYDYTNLEDESYTLKYTAYAALMDGTAVCQGYATLFYRMALTAGVDTRVIIGDAGGAHAWNIALLDSLYYNLDSTWDAGQTEYAWFLKCPASFTGHTRDAAYDSEDFHAVYPMAAADYVPGEVHTHKYEAEVTEPTCTEKGYTTYTCACGDTYIADEVDALGHTEETVPGKAPTCTETGLTDGVKCSVCGEIITEQETIDATGHTEETIPGKAPTCTESGLTDGVKCSVCGEIITEQETIDATGHTEETIPGKAPTCTETGLTDGLKCSVCGEIITEQETIDALGHSWDEGEVTTQPTEDATGVRTYTCTVCGETKTETIPALEHTHKYEAEVTEPTCTEKGYTTYTCACGDTYTADEVDALGHTEETIPGKAPTCTETGLTDGVKCSVCGEILTEQETIDALGHTEETIPGKAPTCTESGLTDGLKCSVCGEVLTEQETIDATGHSWDEGEVTTQPTEDATGVRTYTCTVCGETKTETIPALEHTHKYEAEVTEPTCTEKGYTTYTCACGDTYTADEVDALGHTEETVPGKAPTCTETGLTDGLKCSVCGEIITEQETIDALGHSWDEGEVTTQPTEDATGVRTYTCTVCGETKTETIPALEHTHKYEAEVTEPTCTEKGYTTYTCACGDTYIADEVDATGHTEEIIPGKAPTCTETGLTDGLKCSVCGEVLTEQETIDATGHSWDEGEVTTQPTEDATGVRTYTCTVCGETKTETIPALEHTHKYEAEVTEPTCTEKGYTTYTCACGDTYTADEVDALGHTEETVPGKAPTCTETGLTDGLKCSVCGEVLTEQETIDATGHTEETIPGKAPTCTETGLTDGVKCSVCGEIITEQETIDALGHSFTDGTCTVCGAAEGTATPGDFTGDNLVTNEDVSYLLWHTLFPNDYPLPSDADFTGDGVVTNEDVSQLLWHSLFPNDYPLYIPTTSDEKGKKK